MAQLDIFQLLDYLEDVRVLKLLRNQPDSAKQENEYGETPLYYACIQRAPVEVVDALLKAWPEAVKEKNSNGWTPLHEACHRGAPFE
eukprot:3371299-Ditylum_brightwellii.AAC.1